MSDPLDSIVYINELYNEYGNGNSIIKAKQEEDDQADSGDNSDSYIKVKVNVSSF